MSALPAFLVASASGGAGKSLLSLGLALALRRRGHAVLGFKKGPDYIDAAWLGLACGRPARNLDLFFQDAQALRRRFASALAAARGPGAVALVEGSRGLYDGRDEAGSCSSAALARALDIPVLLCLDCSLMTRTAAALARGLCLFESGLKFCGLVLNRVGSPRHELALRQALEAELSIPLLGCLPRLDKNPLPERQMGLACAGPALAPDARDRLERLADLVARQLDLDLLLRQIEPAPGPEGRPAPSAQEPRSAPDRARSPAGRRAPRIGYLRDGAIWLYYPENLAALARAGARLVPLALVDAEGRDIFEARAWDGLDGLYMGGGFPEDAARALAASPGPALLRRLALDGLPLYAEGGGLLVLGQSLTAQGATHAMAGLFPLAASLGKKPAALGYASASVCRANPFFALGAAFRGHEFHYCRCACEEQDMVLRLSPGRGLATQASGRGTDAPAALSSRDGLLRTNAYGSCLHIFAPAVPAWAPAFVAAARSWRQKGLIRI